jgi:ribonuclease VapC
MSAASLVEITMVSESRRGKTIGIDAWLEKTGIFIEAVDREQADAACQAWRKYDKGRHLAGLNFGDCFSYALAKSRSQRLLFKGNDFSQTDIEAA